MAEPNTALIVIDAQQEYFAPLGKVVLPGGPAAVRRIADALKWAREQKLPVIHVVHESRKPNAAIFAPGSPALEIHPDARPIERVVLAGFMTQMCVDTTARQAAHLGFRVTVLSDATAAMGVKGPEGKPISAEQVHRTHLGSLSGFLAEVKPLGAVINT